jgi:hypothetical protein
MRWLIEPGVFGPDYGARMTAAVEAAGAAVLRWDDAWWTRGLPAIDDAVIFHGSLGNAAAIVARCPGWKPGAYCAVEAFRCSTWYPRAERWLLQRRHVILPASALVANPRAALDRLGVDEVFVRPDSPLKPFSGRVLPADGITLQALDHGFYYDDADLPVVVAPTQPVGPEWRFVVVDRQIVAGSAYVAAGRAARAAAVPESVRAYAAEIAAELAPPEPVYVLDVCDAADGLRLMELNPFSGADLYGCDLHAVVEAVGRLVEADHGD